MPTIQNPTKNDHRGPGPRPPAGRQGTFFFMTPCLHRRTELRWRWARNGALHLGEYCAHCRCWLCWLPQTAWILAGAPPRPRPR